MRTPTRFRTETKYQKKQEAKANTNPLIMAVVGLGDGTTVATGRANFYWIRLVNDQNRLTQCYSMLSLGYGDYIYVRRAKDRKLTYYEFVEWIRDALGGTHAPICPKWAQVIGVSIDGCQYTLLSYAVDHINALIAAGMAAPSATSPWLILMMAGYFDEGTRTGGAADITIIPHVHVRGQGESTMIDMDNNRIVLQHDASMEELNIYGTGSDNNNIVQITQNWVTLRELRIYHDPPDPGNGSVGICIRIDSADHAELYHVICEPESAWCLAGIYLDDSEDALLWDCKVLQS